MKKKNLRYLVVVFSIVALFSAACAKKAPPVQHSKPVRQHAVDPKAQQRYYDQGLQFYSKENYSEAREAFQQAVDAGPNSHVGVKAQENIRKIDQILKTLEEMEKK